MRGQIPSNIISIILGLIIIGSLMVFGYSAFAGLKDKQDIAEFTNLKLDIENTVRKLSSEYGSTKYKEFTLPNKYDEMCFLDFEGEPLASNCADLSASKYNLINDSYTDKTPQTVFILGKSVPPHVLEVPNIKNKDTCRLFCVKGNNLIVSVKIEGHGDHVTIS